MSLKRRLLISVLAIFGISAAMFAATWIITSAQKADGLGINLAGRQRMLVQKMTKEAVAYVHDLKEGRKNEALAGTIQSQMDGFEANLQALIAGGQVSGAGARISVPPASNLIAAQLRQVQSQWLTYKSSLQEAMKEGRVAHLIEGSDALVAPMEKAVAMLQEESEERVTLLLWSQTIGVLAGLVLVAVVMVMMQKGLVGPLEALKAYARSVSEGDLKAAVTGQFTAELGALKESIERMVEGLGRSMEAARRKEVQAAESEAEARAALEKAKAEEARSAGLLSRMTTAAATARGVSERVSSETANLLDQVGHVSRGADLQRDRMTETATAMEEMNATVLEVARNAAHAAESAEQAKDKAATGAAGVRSAVSSIENIRQRIIALKESMARLGHQADSIGNIMNVISDIADQTNLLALNAAIEAARAGDAGRGFAVVADEVRKLAEKTMTATKEVGDAVQSIQNQARENIEAVEGAASGIEDSTRAAEESGRFMDEIVGIIDDTATQVLSIATASEEQSAASEEINRAVEEVSSIAHDTAQDMAGASRGLEMLTNLARELDGVIRDMGDESGGEGFSSRLAALDSEVSRSRAAVAPVRERASLPAGSRPANGGGILQWDDSLSVNVAEIDEQHKELVRMINEMHEAMRTGKGKKAIGDILTRLENYTVNHFALEEKYMQKYGYPGYLNHKKEHEALVGKVMDFDKEFRSGRAALSTEVMNFLKNWLVRHIKGTDKKYSAFFNQKGLH